MWLRLLQLLQSESESGSVTVTQTLYLPFNSASVSCFKLLCGSTFLNLSAHLFHARVSETSGLTFGELLFQVILKLDWEYSTITIVSRLPFFRDSCYEFKPFETRNSAPLLPFINKITRLAVDAGLNGTEIRKLYLPISGFIGSFTGSAFLNDIASRPDECLENYQRNTKEP